MNNQIKNAIDKGQCILFLGAGASLSSKNQSNNNVPSGQELKEILANEASINIEDTDTLADVYAAALSLLGSTQIEGIFERNFKYCTPSNEYTKLVEYPFPRIYTLNIDDALEKAASSKPVNNLCVYKRNDRLDDIDLLKQKIQLIKLNGDINTPKDGFIFSQAEYGEGSSKEPTWYQELARDFHRFTFIFIGTKLNESLFYHQIKRYSEKTKEQNTKSFLIVPTLSDAQKISLSSMNIEHIHGGLDNFVAWLEDTYSTKITFLDIIKKNNQGLDFICKDKEHQISVFSDVIGVSRSSLSLEDDEHAEVKLFYKGYKPSWDDILRSVPALLTNTKDFYDEIIKRHSDNNLFVILGSAGTGKTTSLKQIALMLSEKMSENVYYINGTHQNLRELIIKLNDRNEGKYFLCIDRIANLAVDIDEVLSSSIGSQVILIGTENLKFWRSRVQEHLYRHKPILREFETIHLDDVDLILNKLESYGNWTRLNKMSPKGRRDELYRKAKKQLLIGLLEATSGEGFDNIIKKDYNTINSDDEKALLIISGIASLHRSEISISIASRVLSYLKIENSITNILNNMAGIILNKDGYLSTRHRIYFERLADKFIDKDLLNKIIIAYINAYVHYEFPIVKNISKKDSTVYKGIVNFRFLNKVLKENQSDILKIYSSFEKLLEHEGLFLLQYALALRAFNQHDDALNKLIQAREAYPDSAHIEHAYAHQLLILAEIASINKDENIALSYLERAKLILDSLLTANSRFLDKYPIITLSISHIKILHNLERRDEAQKLAGEYYNTLNKNFPEGKVDDNSSISKTKRFLMHYFTQGKLSLEDLSDDEETVFYY